MACGCGGGEDETSRKKRRASTQAVTPLLWDKAAAGLIGTARVRREYEEPIKVQENKPWWRRGWEWVEAKVVQPVQNAIPGVMNWVDQHQTEITIGIGIAAGVAAIVLSGGAATPLVAATWIAGSAAVAGGVVARPLTTNLWRNVGYAAGAAALTATVGFALGGGVVQQGLYTVGNTATRLCVAHPAACARVEAALELQLERLDGTPGNTTFREVQETLSTLVGRYGDEVAALVRRFGNDGAELLAKYQDDVVELLQKGERAPGEWTDYVPSRYYTHERKAVPVRLTEDLTLYRYWGGDSEEIGPWLTTRSDWIPEQARAWLALPDANSADKITPFMVSKDTVILIGEAANQSGAEWAGPYAVGGGLQVYLSDPSVLIKKP